MAKDRKNLFAELQEQDVEQKKAVVAPASVDDDGYIRVTVSMPKSVKSQIDVYLAQHLVETGEKLTLSQLVRDAVLDKIQ